MIWGVTTIDEAFIAAFLWTGEPNQEVIDAFLSHKGGPLHQMKNQGKRWYYLLKDNPRVSLVTIGRPLADWRGTTKLIVGTREIIGEFPGNRAFIGQKGLQIKAEPGEWLRGLPDRQFDRASQILGAISEQILDQQRIDAVQERIKKRYQW